MTAANEKKPYWKKKQPYSLYMEMSDLIKGHQTICCNTKWFKYLGPVQTYPFLFENRDFFLAVHDTRVQ